MVLLLNSNNCSLTRARVSKLVAGRSSRGGYAMLERIARPPVPVVCLSLIGCCLRVLFGFQLVVCV